MDNADDRTLVQGNLEERERCQELAREVLEASDQAGASALASLREACTPEMLVATFARLGWLEPARTLERTVPFLGFPHCPDGVKTVAVYYFRFGMGGAERVVFNLVNLWRAMGLRVVLITEEDRQEGDYALPADVPRVVIPDFRQATPENYEQRGRALREALEAHQVDTLVYCQWLSHVLAWDLLLCKVLGIPLIAYTHGSFRCMLCEGDILDFQQPYVYGYAEGVLVLSETDRRFWRSFNERVWPTVNPVTLAPNAKTVSQLEGETVVWVGRLSPFDKQPGEALQIMAQVVKEKPQAKLVMVGPAPDEETWQALHEEARSLGIKDNVEFVGAQEDVEPFLRSASVYLLTSRYEGYCLALAESKAKGLPCVMYRLPYLRLTQGNRGIMAVPHGDRKGAARAICKLLDDKDLRVRLGSEAFELMEEIARFDFVALWKDVFRSLRAPLSTVRSGDGENDLMWDVLLDSCGESLRKLHGIVAFLEERERAAECERKRAVDRAQEVEQSTTYKVGSWITAVPRRVKDVLAARRQK